MTPSRAKNSSAQAPIANGLAVVAAVALGALTLVPSSATRMHTWPWALVAALFWLAPLVLLATSARGAARRPPLLLLGGLMILATTSVLSAWASPFTPSALAHTWPLLGGVALCLAFHSNLSVEDPAAASARARRLALALAAGGGIVALVSLVGWAGARASVDGPVRNAFPFGHSTYTGGVMVLVLPWLALQAWQTRRGARLIWLVAAGIALLALITTSSRGAVLGIAVVVLIGCGIGVASGRWTRAQKWGVLAAAFAVVLATFLTNQRLRDLAMHGAWTEAASESNRQRSAMIAGGLELGRQRPWLGWGAGSVPLAYPRVRAKLDGGVENVLQLHNTPVQLWATLGASGLLAAVLLGIGVSRAARDTLRRGDERPVTFAALASLGGYAIFTLTDHQFDLPIVTVLMAANAALLSRRGESDDPLGPRPSPVALAAATALALLALAPAWALVADLRGRHAFARALELHDAGRPADFAVALDAAHRLAPHDPFYLHQAAGAWLRAAERERDPARRHALTANAIARLEASLRTDAHEEFAHFNLGWLELAQHEPVVAARHFIAAARLVPDKGGVYFGLGLALLEANRRADAVRAFALEWINDPRSLTSPAWELPALAALRGEVRAETLRLYDGMRAAYPRSRDAENWTRFWLGEDITPDALARAFTSEAGRFAAALPRLAARGDEVLPDGAWARAYHAWRNAGSAANAGEAFAALAPHDPQFSAALTRRAARQREDFRAFLTAPTGDEPALVTTLRRRRTGYGVLAGHPDAPVLTDVYVVQEHRVVSAFAAELFPPKGWLPGRFLLALLPADPR